MSSTDVIDTEPVAPARALELRRPDVPADLNEIAALRSTGVEIVEARALVLTTLRKAAIRMTSPADWLLFKSPEEQGGQIVGYLQDCGADRVRDLYGIEIFGLSAPELVETNDKEVFHYLITGSGRCKLTRQVLEDVEGGRSSTDDFCKGKTGLELKLAVRKAARANLDGNITRELSGLKSVPVEEIAAAWEGLNKKTENCRRGRGFGTRDERVGGTSGKTPEVDPPVCPHCNSKGAYRPGKDGRKPFYGCPNYQKHPNQKFIVDAEKWVAEQQAKTATTPATNGAPAGKTTPPTSDEIFGGGRQPGEEG